jgi:ABC-type transport system substrate-binding protein
MKNRKFAVLMLALVLVISTFTGCGSSKSDSASSDHVFTIASSTDCGAEVNPHLYHSGAAFYALENIYDPLVMYADGEIQPAIADEWKVSDDGLTYTFHIRDNCKFSDGSICDANNVVKNFDAILRTKSHMHGWVFAPTWISIML